MISLKFDISLSVERSEWAKKFVEASPSDRAIMLSQVMDAFNDGEPGIELSFSEPIIHEHEDATGA